MKAIHLSFLLSLFLLPSSLIAQEAESNGYIFPDFTDGFVFNKDGGRITAKLNYYTIEQKMLFKDAEGKLMEFGVPESVEAVSINDRYFVNSGNGPFYEQIAVGETHYYVQWSAKVLSSGKGVGYGGYSSTTAVTNISGIGSSGDYTPLKPDEKVMTLTSSSYYLKVKNNYSKINSLKTLVKLFKKHQSEIEGFVNDQKIDFTKASDIAKVAEFCYPFTK